MYHIIGTDGREYGPVTLDQLRQWLVKNQINSQTRVKIDGGEWKVPSEFSELVATTSPSTPPPFIASPIAAMSPTSKSKLAAGLLGIFLGGLGVHNFYLGYTSKAMTQLLLTIIGVPLILACGIGFAIIIAVRVWTFVEAILILSGNTITTDANGIPLKD